MDLLKDIMANGKDKSNRTGVKTKAVFGRQLRFDLSKGFPIITTKKIHFKSVLHELLWFLKGEGNIQYLKDNGVTIWNEWADKNGNLGKIYGCQWRNWENNKNIVSVQPKICKHDKVSYPMWELLDFSFDEDDLVGY